MPSLLDQLQSSPTINDGDTAWKTHQASKEAADFFAKHWPLSQAPTRAVERIKAGVLVGDEWQKVNAMIERKMAKHRGILMALVGTRGPGKTQLAVCAMHRACLASKTVRYVKAMDFFAELKTAYLPDSKEGERDVVKRFCKPRLLVIDGIEERGETPWENRMLSHLIDRRYDDMTDTILVANLLKDAFVASIGPSAESRMRETGGVIPCEWQSFRG